MRRTIGGAVLILAALAMPSAADIPAGAGTIAAATVAEEPCPPQAEVSQVELLGNQVAAVQDCRDCGLETAVAVDRPGRVGKAQFSPLGEAVLNLLRSQGGGHLRP